MSLATTEALAPDYLTATLDAGRTLREPGVYFGLAEQDYHDDAALGSSDMRKLASSPADFWWQSKLNPDWLPTEPTKDQCVGTAYHVMVLEGAESFARKYACKTENWATREGKVQKAAFEAAGLAPIGVEDWNRIHQAAAIIKNNPFLGEAFIGGVASEVSIFWTLNGVPKKCRIDYFKARASVDLKSIANENELPFPQACANQIARYDYLIQAEHYREGRACVAQLLADGCVYGDHDSSAFKKAAASKEFAWVWVFLQKARAPLTWGTSVSPGNPMLKWVREARLDKAEENWRSCMETFGPQTPWLQAEPIRELAIEDLPMWYARDGARI